MWEVAGVLPGSQLTVRAGMVPRSVPPSKKRSLHTVFSHFLHKVLKDSFLLSLIGLALVHVCEHFGTPG